MVVHGWLYYVRHPSKQEHLDIHRNKGKIVPDIDDDQNNLGEGVCAS